MCCFCRTVVGFKAVATGGKVKSSSVNVTANALTSGMYTFWRDEGTELGDGTTFNAQGKVANCLQACDGDDNCAAVVMTEVTLNQAGDTLTSCSLRAGKVDVSAFTRSVTKADMRAGYRTLSGLGLPGMYIRLYGHNGHNRNTVPDT
jgi:hypothetical protein